MTAPAFPIYESSDFGRIRAITFIKSVSQADSISLFQLLRLLHPSLLEGSSRPALESYGVRNHYNRRAVGAITELVDENTGVSIPLGDAHALVVAMIDLPHEMTRLAVVGWLRGNAVARFDWDSIARRVLGVCNQPTST